MASAGLTLARWRGLLAETVEPDLRTVKVVVDRLRVPCDDLVTT